MVVDSGPGSTVLSSGISSKTLPSLLFHAASTHGVFFAASEVADSDEVFSAGSEDSDVVFHNTSSIFLTSAINPSFPSLGVSAFVKFLER